VTKIDPGLQLGAAVREQLAALRERPGTARSADAGRPGQAAAPPGGLHATLAQRIQAIAPDDPDRPRKAVRLLLEERLAREFGAALPGDPEFAAMLDAIQDRMSQDAQLAASVAALGQLLVAGKVPPA
jgi:hypothetical protein